MNRVHVAVTELVFAGMIWGFGFIATIWALESFSAVGMTFIRFALATIIGFLFAALIPTWRKSLNKQQLRIALIPGLLLALLMIFQTWGLEFTTATNSGFITTLYVVLVPLYQVLFLKKKLHPFHYLFVALGLFGTALIMKMEFNQFNKGDFLTFVCANFAALHIIQIDRVQKQIQSPFVFNVFQSLWAAAVALIALFFVSGPHILTIKSHAVYGLFFLLLFSSLIGFFLQVRAQKVLSPALSSILFLLEAPFAFVFAIILLHESLAPMQMIGATLILVAAFGAVRVEAPKTRASA